MHSDNICSYRIFYCIAFSGRAPPGSKPPFANVASPLGALLSRAVGLLNCQCYCCYYYYYYYQQ